MKTVLIILALFSFSFLNAQYSKGKIYLKDETSLEGFVQIKDMQIVSFKINRKDTPVEYNHETINSVHVNNTKYEYVKSKNFDTPKLLSEMIQGKIKLYSFITFSTGGYSSNGISSGPQRIPYYYISVKDSLISVGSKFNKKQITVFNDCPSLVKKIKTKEFKKWDIYDIVEFYNEDCN
ncbi:hypothetical protein [Hyunsoonleella pacifica]|uniref:GLPGLI family protein n=1 Tax=Hyunsoonleella pacifica TaxID=1080224 RepID=A0A4Q9FR08_9FLAO|nr:hypothetical protein [Hyunsoonleella pacifica]TBN16701.1 hypothetical protein EYD46_08710 [Hyunsoonleella pacifica]GGD17179.1 hypothetical protein GCM10011368_18930 [Hyunsoonleella pacifica]